jgi:hypothetical protein
MRGCDSIVAVMHPSPERFGKMALQIAAKTCKIRDSHATKQKL